MNNKLNRREFIELSGKGALGAATGLSGVEKYIDQFTTNDAPASEDNQSGNNAKSASSTLSLPKGGGAVKGIGETFQANPFTGTGNFSVPIYTSTGRGGFHPELSLQYSTGSGNGTFGMGWGFSVPSVSRKTEKGIPKYEDFDGGAITNKDVFLLSGAEDLVPVLTDEGKPFREVDDYRVYRYRSRTEGLFARIEWWVEKNNLSSLHSFWKITTKENITSIYGKNEPAQLRKTEGTKGVFEWKLELTYDAKGNVILYQYQEDTIDDNTINQLHEKHRKKNTIYQTYLHKICYGNLKPFEIEGTEKTIENALKIPDEEFFFKTVFDYRIEKGNQVIENDIYSSLTPASWSERDDAFSNHRAGFEIRTYRLCQRVLMFHRIDVEKEGGGIEHQEILVRSTDFHYEPNAYNGMSMLQKVTQRGYRKHEGNHFSEEKYIENYGSPWVESKAYAIKSFPPISFTYTAFQPKLQRFVSLEGELPNVPIKGNYTLIDINANGLPDLLHTSPTAGFIYWENEGNGKFAKGRPLKNFPTGLEIAQNGVGFMDLNGNGRPELVTQGGYVFELDGRDGFQKTGLTLNNVPTNYAEDPNKRMLDLTGDGKADILDTGGGKLKYFKSKGEEGFDPAVYIRAGADDFNISSPYVKFADMMGDGLQDRVIVHSRSLDYYPNQGYGKFGDKITLQIPESLGVNFNPSLLYLVDVDGSGVADVVYFDSGRIRIWFNQSGNKLSETISIAGVPKISDQSSIVFTDLYGNGTTGVLMYAATSSRGKLFYMDFSGGTKPNLLTEMSNNMGSTTKAVYKSSTHFYLKDLKNNPRKGGWVSSLPFPVQVLEKVEKIDHISRTKLVTKYRYHHGFYDGREREFRGFAYVEQEDTEIFNDFQNDLHDNADVRNKSKAYHVPPILTKTWFHTGVYKKEDLRKNVQDLIDKKEEGLKIHKHLDYQYWNGDVEAFDLENTVFDLNGGQVDIASMSEAYRALRGQVLRQEVYAKDGSSKQDIPYTVTESNAKVRLVQPKGRNKHAVYFVHSHESLSYHYERNVDDPRMVQEMTLEVDDYGNVLKSASIGYPRRMAKFDEQELLYITLSENKFAKEAKDDAACYYTGIPYENQSFELHNYAWASSDKKIKQEDLTKAVNTLNTNYERFDIDQTRQAGLYKRLLSWSRSYFKKDEDAACIEIDKSGDCPQRSYNCRLDLGDIGCLLLPYESYQAAFSNEQIKEIFSSLPQNDLENLLCKGGYIKMENHWWIPSGQQAYDSSQFYLPIESCDPFGNKSQIKYEGKKLLIESATNPLGNEVKAENDYITMQPKKIIDPNKNNSKVVFDALGLVAASAVMENDENGDFINGDPLEKFSPIWEYEDWIDYMDKPYSVSNDGRDYLQDATTAMIYDLWATVRKGQKEPPTVFSISRETHAFSKEKDSENRWKAKENSPAIVQRQLVYFDGLGREVQTKIEAEPDPKTKKSRWINSGWKIYNNKGKPVQQYEPFYSNESEFQDVYELTDNFTDSSKIEFGVSPTIFYDPLERVVATIQPDGSFEKVKFDAWYQETWDRNDTVCWNPDDAKENPVIQKWREANPNFKTWKKRIEDKPTAALEAALAKTLEHQDSPSMVHLDSLGRPFLTVVHNGAFESDPFKTHVALDIQGNDLHITDPRGNQLFTHTFNMLQQQLVVDSKDAGKKLLLQAVDEQPIWSKDARGTIVEPEYDELRRPSESWVQPMGGKKILVVKTEYGKDNNTTAQSKNEIGQVLQIKDQSGVIKNLEFDFKGNVLGTQRQLWEKFKGDIDLNTNDPISILKKGNEERIFTSSSTFDALNRVIESKAPNGSIFQPVYNKTNQLKSLSVKLFVKEEDGQIIYKDKTFVKNIDYNARGQRERIQYGNGITTTYKYDDYTFRLEKLISSKDNGTVFLQKLFYTYDPVGNITQICDDAFETIFYCNERIEPKSDYTYDALYRLIKATGRQHVSYSGCEYMDKTKQATLINFRCELFQSQNNQQQLTTYTQYYQYDKAGNITEIKHVPTNSSARGWTRTQTYNDKNNQIKTTKTGSCYPSKESEDIKHDPNGNIEKMPHLQNIEWDFANQMHKVQLKSGDKHFAYYVYGSDGMRSRKVIVHNENIYTQRLYLNGYEIFIDGNTEKATLHINDDNNRIALVEKENNTNDPKIKYQLANHLGSATLETDADGKHLSYEEYTPYGGTAYIACTPDNDNKAAHAEQKRYRYSGKERDDETGLYYYGARYYAPWMGRWMKADPIGKGDGLNVFGFVGGNPICFFDIHGLTKGEVINVESAESGSVEIIPEENRTIVSWLDGDGGFDDSDTPPPTSNSSSPVEELPIVNDSSHENSDKVEGKRNLGNRGGRTLAMGIIGVVVGVGAIISGGSLLALLGGAMSLSSGIVVGAAGGAQMAKSYAGNSSYEEDLEFGETMDKVFTLTSNPLNLTSGAIGGIIGGEKGVHQGAEIADEIQSIVGHVSNPINRVHEKYSRNVSRNLPTRKRAKDARPRPRPKKKGEPATTRQSKNQKGIGNRPDRHKNHSDSGTHFHDENHSDISKLNVHYRWKKR